MKRVMQPKPTSAAMPKARASLKKTERLTVFILVFLAVSPSITFSSGQIEIAPLGFKELYQFSLYSILASFVVDFLIARKSYKCWSNLKNKLIKIESCFCQKIIFFTF